MKKILIFVFLFILFLCSCQHTEQKNGDLEFSDAFLKFKMIGK